MKPTIDNLRADLEQAVGGPLEEATVCVAWSGGLDSTVLLELSCRLRRDLDLTVGAVHVDHGVRGSSGEDAAFCRRLASEWGIALRVEEIAPREEGASEEAKLRRQRYAAVADAAEAFGAEVVLTGHQANDAVETALLRFMRGTGAAGFSNLAPRNRIVRPEDEGGPIASWPAIPILRPLLESSRQELRDYASERGLEWRTDPTNRSDDYRRNRLRRRVMPAFLEEAGSEEPLLRTLDNIADDAAALEGHVGELFDDARLEPGTIESACFETAVLADGADAEIAAVLRRASSRLPGPVRWTRERLEASWEAVRSVASGEAKRRQVDAGGVRLTVEEEVTELALARARGGRDLDRRTARAMSVDPSSEGEMPWFDVTIRWATRRPADASEVPAAAEVAWFDRDELGDELVLRGPRPGERLEPFGMEGTKAVADVLREGEVPESRRWRWPCLALRDEDGEPGACLWVCGLRQSRRGRVTESTERIVEVTYDKRAAVGRRGDSTDEDRDRS